MTKEKALYEWFNSFGIPAYPATAVPEDATFPYMTYTPKTSAFLDYQVSITVLLYYKTFSEAIPSAKAEEIAKEIRYGRRMLRCDDGLIWLKTDSPWSQSIEQDDNSLKTRQLLVIAEYLTY